MKQNKNGRRMRSGFVVPTVAEIAEERKKFLDAKSREVINKIFDIQFNMIQFRQIKSRISFRELQLKEGVSELFNGTLKPKDMLEAELDADIYAHNRMIGEIKDNREFLENEGFTKDEIAEMSIGKFDVNSWVKKNSKQEDKGNTNYMG